MSKALRPFKHTLVLALSLYLACLSISAAAGSKVAPGISSGYPLAPSLSYTSQGKSLLPFEDFDDGVADGFQAASGEWALVEGRYAQLNDDPPGPYRSWADAGQLTQYTIDLDFIPLSGVETKVIYAHADAGEDYRVDFSLGQSRLSMPPWGGTWQSRNFMVGGLGLSYGQTYRVKVQVGLAGVKVWLDGLLLHYRAWADYEPLGDGNIGLGNWAGSSSFDNVTIYEEIGDPWRLKFVKLAGSQDANMPQPSVVYDADAQAYIVTSAGHDMWDSQDGCGFAYTAVEGDFSVIVRLYTDFTGPATDAWSKAGVMVRDSLNPGAKDVYYVSSRSEGNALLQWRDSDDSTPDWPGVPDVPAGGLLYPYFLRLDRRGDTFTGYYSTDGMKWTRGSSHTNPDISDPVYVGLALSSHEETVPSTMLFGNLSIEGPYWVGDTLGLKFAKLAGNQDANMPDPSVAYDPEAQTYTVTSAGHDMWDSQDGCAFACAPFRGDFSVVVRLDTDFSGPAANEWSKAGVMVRDSLSPGSKDVYYVSSRSLGDALMQWRDADDALTSWPGFADVPPGELGYPHFLRLDRRGDTFTGYYSTDGVNWHQGSSHTNLDFSDHVYVGFALSSHEETVETTMVFSQFSVSWLPPERTLFENFDDGVADGFAEVGGSWDASGGIYFQFTEDPPGPFRSWVDAGDLIEYTIEVDCTPLSGTETKVIYAHADTCEDYRVDIALNELTLCMPAWGQPWDTRYFTVQGLDLYYYGTYHVKIKVGLEGVRVWLDGVLHHYQPWADDVPLGDGKVGLGTWAAISGFDNVKVYSGAPRPNEYTVEVDCTPLSGTETKVIYAHADSSEDYRVDFSLDQCRLCIPEWGQGWQSRNFLAEGINFSYNETHHVVIDVSLWGVMVWLDDVLLHEAAWANYQPLGDGKVGLGCWGGTSSFDNLAVYAGDPWPTTLLYEDFDDGAADGFNEVGGKWEAFEGQYLQSVEEPAGPYRSWVDAGELASITIHAKPPQAFLGQPACIFGSLTDPSGKGLADREIEIRVWPPEQKTPELFYAVTDANGDYVFYLRPPYAGSGWAATAFWPGDALYDEAMTESPALFDVLPADTKASIASSACSILQSYSVDIFGRLTTTTRLPPQSDVLAGQEIYLYLLAPEAEIPETLSTSTDVEGGYGFPNLTLPEIGVWRLWAKFNGSPDLNPSSSDVISIEAKETAGYAILVSGRGDDDTLLESHNRTADTVYHKLLQRGLNAESIFYLRFGFPVDGSILVDGQPAASAIGYAITTWARQQMTAQPGSLFILFIGSGERRHFYASGENDSVTPWQLDDWITSLEWSLRGSPAEGQPIAVVLGNPYSGSFIHWLSRGAGPRAIVTSSDSNELPVTGPEEETVARQGDFLVLQLFENLTRGRNLKRSFERAAAATSSYTRNQSGNGLNVGLAYPDLSAHHPLIDDNRDGIGSFGFLSGRPGDDGFLSSQIFLGYGEPEPEAQIIEVSPKQLISSGEQPELWAKVEDRNSVQAVWMVIKPPFFSMGMVSGDPLIHRNVEGIWVPLFDLGADGVYSTTNYPGFTEKGTYTVLFFVKDRYTGQLGEIWKTKVIVFDPDAPGPGEFSILSPQDGATVGAQVLLSWSASQKGSPDDEITYTVQIATDPFFENVVFEQGDIQGTSLLVGEDAGLLDRTTYYWRVTAESFFGKARLARTAGMKSTDIGDSLQGDTTYDMATDSYTILGNGWGSWGKEDQLRFTHTSARGSFEVWARVDFLNGIDGAALAGIMIRQSTDPDSPYVMAAVNSRGEVLCPFRRAPGASASTNELGATSLPTYVKLECLRPSPDDSADITPYFSPDGESWLAGPTINLVMPNDVQVGICVTSGDPGLLAKATVSGFTISPLERGTGGAWKAPASESSLLSSTPPAEPLGTDYGTFKTDQGLGLPGYNVLTVLVYNENDPSESPPGTTIVISPVVGTVHDWMYTGYVPVGSYNIDVSAPNFSSEHRSTNVTTGSPTTEVFTLVPNPGSVSGTVVSGNTGSNLRDADVQLEVTSGTYFGTTYNAVTGADGKFSFTTLPTTINYQITVSKTFYNDYQATFTLNAGEAKNLGTISLSFTDDDNDDLPDEFEQAIVDFDPGDDINDIWDVHGDADFDGDGQTNAEEYLAGTDPTSAASCLRITSIVSNTANAFTITWTSVTGKLYKVHYGDSLGGWSLAASGIAASGTGQNSWTDDNTSGTVPPPGSATLRFYRVEAY